MKTAKAPTVPVLENAFEVNLPKLMRAAKATGASRHVLDDGVVRTVAVLTRTRLAVFLGGRQWLVEIVPVQCLGDRVRPLLKCPRAHEANFQSLYLLNCELACRRCHGLRYRSTLVASATARSRIARDKLLKKMGGTPSVGIPDRRSGRWRNKHARQIIRLGMLTKVHYSHLRAYLERQGQNSRAASA